MRHPQTHDAPTPIDRTRPSGVAMAPDLLFFYRSDSGVARWAPSSSSSVVRAGASSARRTIAIADKRRRERVEKDNTLTHTHKERKERGSFLPWFCLIGGFFLGFAKLVEIKQDAFFESAVLLRAAGRSRPPLSLPPTPSFMRLHH